MNFILRNFFYGVGLTMLYLMYQLPAQTAEFAHLVAFVQADAFWKTVGCVAAILAGLDFALSGRPIVSVRPAVFGQGSSASKPTA
jgi:hypothetical protein